MKNNKNRHRRREQRRTFSGIRIWIWMVLTLVFVFWGWSLLEEQLDQRVQISYSAFRQQLEKGAIEAVTVQGPEISGEFKQIPAEAIDGKKLEQRKFLTYLPSFGDDQLLAELQDQGIRVTTEPAEEFSWWVVLPNLLIFLFIFGLFYFFYRQMQARGQGFMSVRQSSARMARPEAQKTTFDDVAGLEGPKREMREIIEFLKDPGRFHKIGAKIPTGVLLVGPPGTGKTLLARAIAGEADVPFLFITGSDFMEMFVGVGASRVRDLFEKAKKNAPSIVFIDELDSIGRRRGTGLGGGHDEREQTLNQLLSAMDGFEPQHSVIVMAATNRPDILDRALLRPGRFDRQVTVEMPTFKERQAILKIHIRDKKIADDVDLELVARSTPGFSGADLENLLNEAALLAARKEKEQIDQEEIDEARDKVMMGLARESLVLSSEDRRMLAYHEAGHAVVGAILRPQEPIHKVSIIPRGKALGGTQQIPEEDKYIYKKESLLDRLAIMMGGRAAEKLVLDALSSGAEDDFRQATRLARRMVSAWGMSSELGPVSLKGEQTQVFLGEELARKRDYSEETARQVDEAVRATLEEAFERSLKVLKEHREELDDLAEKLDEEEEIEGPEILQTLKLEKVNNS